MLRATFLLFQSQLESVARSKRTLVCLVVALVPAALALFVVNVAYVEVDVPPAADIGWGLGVEVIVPVLALIIGSAVVASEVEDRTITYLFTRPMPRVALLFGRWLATLVVLVAILVPSTAAMLAIVHWGLPAGMASPLPAGTALPLLGVVVLGSAVYSAVFAALGTFVKYPMVVGLGYVFAIEVFLSNLPTNSQSLTLKYHLRCVVLDYGSDAWRRVYWFRDQVYDPGADALVTLAWTAAVALAIGAIVVSRRQYVLTA